MNELIGTWQLVATRAWDDDNNELPLPYGETARGLVMFDASQRMMCVLADGQAQTLETGEREYVSYMGHFEYADGVLSTRVDGSSDLDRVGSDQVRGVRLDGERLFLTPPPRPKYGVTEHRELEWRQLTSA